MRLKVGDCAQLKTGGCLMTVAQVFTGLLAGQPDISCVWFNDEGELKDGRFAADALRRWVLDEQPSTQG